MKTVNLLISIILYATQMQAQIVFRSMLRLPDTGQIQSYTNTFGEDHDFNFNAPFFNINGNGTVTDTITGLMWQQNDGGEMTIENAIDYCNNLVLGGFSDWRLPNAHEAFSIINHQNANPALNTSIFTASVAEYWWTSDRQVNDSNKVWVTNSGGGIGNHPKTETISAGGTKKFHVRAVRNIQNPISIASHFTDNGDGSITDNLTQLIWQKTPYADSLTWEDALGYADTLNLSGHNSWRLPNIKELQSINEENRINPSINTTAFGMSAAGKFWSSTSLPNQPTKAWYLNTQFGITTYDVKTAKHLILCVSNNQITSTISELNPMETLVFPNPFQSKINLRNTNGQETFLMTDLQGETIYLGKNITQADFTQLDSGMYILNIFGDSVQRIKLLKQ